MLQTEALVKDLVAELARIHHVTHQAHPLDELADSVSRLSGDDVPALDETQQLLIALDRAGRLTPLQAMELQAQHLIQRRR